MAIYSKNIKLNLGLSAVLVSASLSGCLSGQSQVQKTVTNQVKSQNQEYNKTSEKPFNGEDNKKIQELKETDDLEPNFGSHNFGSHISKKSQEASPSELGTTKAIDNQPIVNIRQQQKMSKISDRHSEQGNLKTIPAIMKYSKIFEGTATAYTHTGHNTATGIRPHRGIVSVDPKVIPLGSKVFIEGYGVAVAADTGGAMRGTKIDVFFETQEECYKWGRRKVKIYVLENK